MVNGKELCKNAYSELNDPIDQLERLQMRLSEKGDDEGSAMIIDKDFVRALELPVCLLLLRHGCLVTPTTGQSTIQEASFFPQMRPEKVIPKDAPAQKQPGIAEKSVPVIQKAGYNLVSDMKDVNLKNYIRTSAE